MANVNTSRELDPVQHALPSVQHAGLAMPDKCPPRTALHAIRITHKSAGFRVRPAAEARP